MKKVEVFFRLVHEGSVTVKVKDDYNEADLREAARFIYDDDDLYYPGQLEVTNYEEK